MQQYANHLDTLRVRYQTALSANGYDQVIINAGQLTYYADDDHAHPFHPYPFAQQWLPYRLVPNTFVVISLHDKPRLIWPAQEDFWHVSPQEPQGEWTEHWRITGAMTLKDWLPSLSGNIAWLGPVPTELNQLAPQIAVNPSGMKSTLAYQRAYKTPYEVQWLIEASERGVAGHRAAKQAFYEGLSELEIYRAFLTASGQREIDEPYPGIVGVNASAAVLHYEHKSPRRPDSARTLLIDAGAQANGYASDITRTYTTSDGLFGALLADMDVLQRNLVAGATVGTAFPELHTRALQGVADILRQHKLCTLSVDEQMAKRIPQVFYPHGLGHLLGLQVHDLTGHQIDIMGTVQKPTEEAPFLRLTRTLETDMVLTIEPGLYFIPMLLKHMTDTHHQHGCDLTLIEQLMPFGGIRIEDNILVTAQGPRNLTREAFVDSAG
ncbi:Xaa-Pro dipeptidase [Salinispirillum marinum]|uniref:Xaa-Pro dipeptidase n=2 Tax=Saccharospirillaceae TaxID=255527 RepID=A0ABV8BEQ3_9GAMM